MVCQVVGKEVLDIVILVLVKVVFLMGKDEEGVKLIVEVVKFDYENKILQMLVCKVLVDIGCVNLVEELIDGVVKYCMSIIVEVNVFMCSVKFDELLVWLEEVLVSMLENIGVLLVVVQLYLLWMSQCGWNEEYVKCVCCYLVILDCLIFGNDRVVKMYKFLCDILIKVVLKS